MARIEDRDTGWWVFVGSLLMIAGIERHLGIAAIGDAKFFIANQKYFVVSSVHTWPG